MTQLIVGHWVCEKRGEGTASAMESQLTSLEKKIDDLLASVDGNVPHRDGQVEGGGGVGKSDLDHSSA